MADLLGGPKQGEKASDYFKNNCATAGFFVGFDCDDDGLGTRGYQRRTAIVSVRQRLPARSVSTRRNAGMKSTSFWAR